MDLLDRVAAPGRDLLGRVDTVLTAGGAPPEHRVWVLLRQLGALPGSVFEAFCRFDPVPLGDAGSALHRRAEGYADERADLDAAVAATHWEGGAADGFTATWRACGHHLGDHTDPEAATLAGRLTATAGYVADIAGWMRAARVAMAHTTAEALGSIEAVTVRSGGTGDVATTTAAATIAVVVLDTAARQIVAAEAVDRRWSARLSDLQMRAPSGVATGSGGPTRVAL